MNKTKYAQPFITDHRIQFAVNLANEIAEKDHSATAYDCASSAVHKIFDRWLIDYSGTVKPEFLPVYLRLVCDVDQRMGLHRRRRSVSSPIEPAAAAWPVAFNNLDTQASPEVLAA